MDKDSVRIVDEYMQKRFKTQSQHLAVLWLLIAVLGCGTTPNKLLLKDMTQTFEEGSIISGRTGSPVTYEALIKDLAGVRVVYVGENHRDIYHHQIQLQIIQSLLKQSPNLVVGMEMFDRSYQPVLDQWTEGELDEKTFLKQVHWYANWRYDFKLYKEIFAFIQEKKIQLVGINIPFHLPSKIAIGGIDSLAPEEKKFLPESIDTTQPEHRAYVKKIFDSHRIKGRDDFENFYMAQCVWEDIMAEAVARHLQDRQMIVLVGNGHIVKKFGVPDRAFSRTHVSFRTVYPARIGNQVELSDADYIWATP
jgi:uncharacterized iron-regulated protein